MRHYDLRAGRLNAGSNPKGIWFSELSDPQRERRPREGQRRGLFHVLIARAQVDLLKKGFPLLRPQGRTIFVTSHLAHFYGQKPVYPGYESVAISKLAGEKELGR